MTVKIRTTISLFEDEYNETPIVSEVIKDEIVRPKDTWTASNRIYYHFSQVKNLWEILRNVF